MEILKGTINKGQGNYYVLSIYSLSALHTFAKLVNGKFRTPKLEALHRLITWINNYGKFEHLELLPVDDLNLTSNAWLAVMPIVILISLFPFLLNLE